MAELSAAANSIVQNVTRQPLQFAIYYAEIVAAVYFTDMGISYLNRTFLSDKLSGLDEEMKNNLLDALKVGGILLVDKLL